jgi:hypothetical protein
MVSGLEQEHLTEATVECRNNMAHQGLSEDPVS